MRTRTLARLLVPAAAGLGLAIGPTAPALAVEHGPELEGNIFLFSVEANLDTATPTDLVDGGGNGLIPWRTIAVDAPCPVAESVIRTVVRVPVAGVSEDQWTEVPVAPPAIEPTTVDSQGRPYNASDTDALTRYEIQEFVTRTGGASNFQLLVVCSDYDAIDIGYWATDLTITGTSSEDLTWERTEPVTLDDVGRRDGDLPWAVPASGGVVLAAVVGLVLWRLRRRRPAQAAGVAHDHPRAGGPTSGAVAGAVVGLALTAVLVLDGSSSARADEGQGGSAQVTIPTGSPTAAPPADSGSAAPGQPDAGPVGAGSTGAGSTDGGSPPVAPTGGGSPQGPGATPAPPSAPSSPSASPSPSPVPSWARPDLAWREDRWLTPPTIALIGLGGVSLLAAIVGGLRKLLAVPRRTP